MKKVLLIALITVFSAGLMAQDKQKDKDLKTLFELMQSDKMIDKIMEGMRGPLTQQAKMQIQGEDAQKKFEEYMQFVTEETAALSKKLIDEEMVAIYDKHFTGQEIKDLVNFYKSSTGQKMIEKTPELSSDLMQAMMQKHLPEFQQNIAKKLEEMQKEDGK